MYGYPAHHQPVHRTAHKLPHCKTPTTMLEWSFCRCTPDDAHCHRTAGPILDDWLDEIVEAEESKGPITKASKSTNTKAPLGFSINRHLGVQNFTCFIKESISRVLARATPFFLNENATNDEKLYFFVRGIYGDDGRTPESAPLLLKSDNTYIRTYIVLCVLENYQRGEYRYEETTTDLACHWPFLAPVGAFVSSLRNHKCDAVCFAAASTVRKSCCGPTTTGGRRCLTGMQLGKHRSN